MREGTLGGGRNYIEGIGGYGVEEVGGNNGKRKRDKRMEGEGKEVREYWESEGRDWRKRKEEGKDEDKGEVEGKGRRYIIVWKEEMRINLSIR